MRATNFSEEENIHELNRSLYRNMPSDCRYCGYRNLPTSSLGDTCGCCYLHSYSTKLK